jgi:hypothetical protein
MNDRQARQHTRRLLALKGQKIALHFASYSALWRADDFLLPPHNLSFLSLLSLA